MRKALATLLILCFFINVKNPSAQAVGLSGGGPEVKSCGDIVAGLNLGSALSAGNAQQAVNQQGVRTETAKQDAGKMETTKTHSYIHKGLNSSSLPTRPIPGQPGLRSFHDKDSSAPSATTGVSPLHHPSAPENW